MLQYSLVRVCVFVEGEVLCVCIGVGEITLGINW